MRTTLSVALFLVFTLSGVALAKDKATQEKAKNVILFVVDDQGFQAGCYGNDVIKTPNLDLLAAAGTRFTQAHCTTASCSASRSVILTGLNNHANGQYGHQHSFHRFRTKENLKTLPVRLTNAGYRTCSIGKFHVGPEEVYHFEKYANKGNQGNRNSVRMAKNAKAFIEEDDERPFFLYFCTSDPHRGGGPDGYSNFNDRPNFYPGVTPVRYDPKDIVVPPWLPNQPEVKRELAEYYQAISRLDQGLGVLIKTLQENDMWDNTLLIFMSDNGPPFPGAKTTLYQPGMNLPLVVRNPDQKTQGKTTDALVSWVDITPTILDFAGVQAKRSNFHGRSFLSVLDTEHPKGWDTIYGSHTFHEITMYYPMRVMRKGNFKYTINLAHQLPYPFASDLYASPTWQGILKRKDGMLGNRPVKDYIQRARHELYDLSVDPHELNNLAKDKNYAEVLADMQEKLKAWQKKTGDPWIVKYRYE